MVKVDISKCADYTLWGKLSVQAVNEAAELLSAEAFRLWVKMAMNQDGYVYHLGDACPAEIIDELVDGGYLHPGNGDRMLFTDGMGAKDGLRPDAWWGVVDSYSGVAAESAEYMHIRHRLETTGILDEMESVLWYWQSRLKELAARREQSSRTINNPIRYDFSVVLVWYLWDHFFFVEGDRLPLDGLRYHDDAVQQKVLRARSARKANVVKMQVANLPYWNDVFSKRKVEVPTEVIGDILRQRQGQAIPA